MKLNIGCGRNKLEGYLNIDISPDVKPEMVADIEQNGLPFKEETVSEVRFDNVLEHLENPIKVLAKLYPYLKKGGEVWIRVPHWSSVASSTDLTHKHQFSSKSLDYLGEDDSMRYEYDNLQLNLIYKKINFSTTYKILGLEFLFNKFRYIYEFYLAGIFQARDIVFILRRDE